MGTPLRIGVLGCAEIARRRMLPAMAASPDVDLAAVASRDRARAEETARPYGCRALQSYEAVLADDSVDAVYIPLPAALHGDWAGAALNAGKHVLVEKPLTTDRARTARLIDSAWDRGLTLMENVMFVHHAQHTTVRELVADGAIGELRSLRAEFTVPRRHADDIRLRPELGGGALWDTGVYPVRAALHLLGPELTVVGAVLTQDPRHAVDTSGAALLRAPDGVTAQLTFGLDHAYRSAYELTGSQGRITLDRAFTPPADHRPVLRLELGSRTEERVLAPDDQVANTLTAFAASARHGAAPHRSGAASLTAGSLRQADLLAETAQAARAPARDRGAVIRN